MVDQQIVCLFVLLLWCVVRCHQGNLIVRSDGKVAFIDFGIVGRINPVTWKAVESLLISLGSEDYNLMARALATMGATSQNVDLISLASDLQEVLTKVQDIDRQLVVSSGPDGTFKILADFAPFSCSLWCLTFIDSASLWIVFSCCGMVLVAGRSPSISAEAMLEDEEINQILINIVQVGETHGIKFPREFGLLLKQILYFDRYVKILSPQLDILKDDRINIRQSPLDPGF